MAEDIALEHKITIFMADKAIEEAHKVGQLKVALERMLYEATHLSAEEEDGSHKCKISKSTLTLARDALNAES